MCYIWNDYIIHNAYSPAMPKDDEQWLVHCILAAYTS